MNILDELIADHERLDSLLVLFERELIAFDTGEKSDMQLMQDIAIYYAEYFNRFHHPLEDCLFERLLNRERRRTVSTHDAINQHNSLRRATDRLSAALDQILHGAVVTRAELIDSGQNFLQQNREHMRHEESQSFERARRRLTASDWAAVNAAANALQNRIDLNSGRRHYDTILASLYKFTMAPEISAASHAHTESELRH